MAFQSGRSGNPNGRPKGALSKRTQLAKLLEPYAESLVAKTVELALAGDVNALRICIERLIPKVHKEPTYIELPKNSAKKNIAELKIKILRAATDGSITIGDAEKLTKLIDGQYKQNANTLSSIVLPIDPIEASKIYQEIMMG